MRQVSKQIAEAFYEGKPKTIGNSHTDGNQVFLHGNRIAWKVDNDKLAITLAGWPTVTTRERLNTILFEFGFNYYLQQVNHEQFLVNFEDKKTPLYDDQVKTFHRIGKRWLLRTNCGGM
tara:strand:- start:539 stop:895 length:357 start_codon:yes stop_codon:yes gene_type:complete